jgi:tripartite-type tricarboxylate transporter receptor subunit TctC
VQIITRINAALNKALQSPDLRKILNASGADTVGGSPEDFAKVVRADFAKWAKVVKDSGARVD